MNQPLRVLALVTDAFGGYGGIAQYNRDFVTALAGQPGVEAVDVLPRLAPDKYEIASERVSQRDPIHARARYGLTAFRAATEFRPNVVYSGHLYHGPLAYLIAQAWGAKLVGQLHGDEIWTRPSRAQLEPLKRSYHLLCVSKDTRDRYVRLAGACGGNAVVLPNMVASDFVTGDRREARRRFHVSDKAVVLTVSRLDPGGYKGHDRIIPMLPHLRAEGRDVVYVIAGEGEDRARLEALCREHGVHEHVRFLGRVPREDLPVLYRAADLFALPSTREGFGIVFLEAMACGTPAIGLAAGGASDALELGFCVSEEAFPEAFVRALDAQVDRACLSAAVHSRFGLASFQARVAQFSASLQHGQGD